jgi:septum formation protein
VTETSKAIYLASKSPRRRELLKQISVAHEVLLMREAAPRIDIDESPRPGESAHVYVERVVLLKAKMAAKAMHDRKLLPQIILSADTTVTIDGDVLGKPVDDQDATRMLQRLSGNSHQVLTAIAVVANDEVTQMLSTSFVTFAPLSDDDIARYVASGEPMDKAGSYAIQGLAASFIVKISGSYSGVMGLPLYETAKLLRQCGH